jgi:CDP-glycerol glycerophosphotransferase
MILPAAMCRRTMAILRHVTIKRGVAVLRDSMKPSRLLSFAFVHFQKALPVDERTILVESHKGESLIGSPYHMVRHMALSPLYRDFRIVVVARDIRGISTLRNAHGARIRVCRPNSISYCRFLATAGLLINDTTFPPYFARRPDQKYLNTWHGTPLKALGRKASHGTLDFVCNTQRNFLHATHLLAPNRHTEDVLLRDYMIEKIARLEVLRCGYPRNDPLIAPRSALLSESDGGHHIAYMPTWRGTLSTSREENEKLLAETRDLLELLDQRLPERFRIWVKLHPMVKGKLDFTPYKRVLPFPESVETYDFLSLCNALVTDYSSVMFDFAATGRPIHVYMPDLRKYRADRDFCMDPLSLPFQRAETGAELVSMLSAPDSRNARAHNWKDFAAEYCPHDNGRSTERLCRHFVLGEPTLEQRQVRPARDRKNVLLFVGSFLNNGITTSVKSLVSCIDLDRCNLFLCVDAASGDSRDAGYFRSLDTRVGFIPTRNFLAVDLVDGASYLARETFQKAFSADDAVLKSIWKREFLRLFGSASFNTIVHFTGYDRRVCMLLLGSDAKKVIFMHNDMYDEISAGRVADPRALRLAYGLADEIAMVRENLDVKFSAQIQDVSSKTRLVPNTLSTTCSEKSLAPLVESLHNDMRSQLGPALQEAMRTAPAFRFVNLARFSAEKGHARLIRAFENVYARHPEAQLYILGPHGILFDETRRQARNSSASRAIFVSQGSANPFPLLAKADAFVFSSHYEGIGLVLFESFALGIPVVATDIPGPAELLSQGYGLVVENSEKGLEDGMLQAISGDIPQRPYDFAAHNQDALQRFYEILE